MPSPLSTVVVIGTGGTIAGTASRPQDLTEYTAGALTAQALIDAVPALAGQALQAESLSQLDSCDMDHATWVRLAKSVQRHLARADVAGVVITHGTDTLEETALFLHLTVQAHKPVVLTAAMRPATAPSPDGPQNLVDALSVVRHAGARGVLAVMGGVVHAAGDVRKLHGYRVDAFSSGDAGPVALLQDGQLRLFRAWPGIDAVRADALEMDPATWPVVDIVTSHAGARGATLDALVASGARGIVIAGTGNGSVHAQLLLAARRAQAQGVRVLRASRCICGGVVGAPADALPSAGEITPAQARVSLLLDLLAGRRCDG